MFVAVGLGRFISGGPIGLILVGALVAIATGTTAAMSEEAILAALDGLGIIPWLDVEEGIETGDGLLHSSHEADQNLLPQYVLGHLEIILGELAMEALVALVDKHASHKVGRITTFRDILGDRPALGLGSVAAFPRCIL
eukprot:CAMPEP_0181065050 /NCGR_PEP_ID=MMETSP1070-20121207/24530_1 /TAXON_ID=265543 /ORGANISM="Minutocellus polymorphus, Strain NH13" /LENGTH=138 /DNA_ID=CAMNT_0023145411 /DNA_START=143 /DNA_END=559 /DNA_ORIENTATION=+